MRGRCSKVGRKERMESVIEKMMRDRWSKVGRKERIE